MSTQLSMTAPTQLGLFDDTSNAAANKVVFVPAPEPITDGGIPDGEWTRLREEATVPEPPRYETPPLYTPAAQAEHLERVTRSIGTVILEFCAAHIGRQFRIADLQRHVSQHLLTAPASPDRVLRELRAKGLVQYAVVSRRDSLYEVVSVNDAKEAA